MRFISSWGIVLACLTLCVGLASATDYTFQATSGRWAVQGNWQPTGSPGANDVAIIPAGKTCYLLAGDTEDAARIQVASGAVLRLQDVCALTLHGHQTASVVNGRIVFTYTGTTPDTCTAGTEPGVLHIADDLTISGEGGIIVGGCRFHGRNDGLISGAEGAVLTLENGRDGELTVTGMLEISAELINNARVSVGFPEGAPEDEDDDPAYVLRLTDEPKSGGGVWSGYEGTFQVDAPVNTDGCWVFRRIKTLALIVNAPCVGQGADAFFEAPDTIAINEDFCASGDFLIGNAEGPGGTTQDPVWRMTVDVADDKTFVLGAACVSP